MKLPSKRSRRTGLILRIKKIFKVSVFAFAILLARTPLGYADHVLNGEDWMELEKVNHTGRLYYIAGVIETMIQSDYEYYYKEMYIPVTHEQLRILIDEFYKDFRNMKIPVFHAIRAIRMQVSGEDNETVESFILELRKLSMTLE